MWDYELNAISMINLVMAVGLIVDYNMHVVHSFSLQDPGLGRVERVVLAMEEMGPAVILGVGSTFVAILPMALAQSQLFRIFFEMLFSIIVLGGLHGLVFTPVLLSVCGQSLAGAGGKPASPDAVMESKQSSDASEPKQVPEEFAEPTTVVDLCQQAPSDGVREQTV